MYYLNRSKYFLFTVLVCLTPLALYRLSANSIDTHLFFTGHGNHGLDLFFKYITYLGDALVLLLISILPMYWLGIIKERKTWILLVGSFLVSTVVILLSKNIIWPHLMRPSGIIDRDALHVISGVSLHKYKSFPSGHSATIVLFAMFFCQYIHKVYGQVLLGILASIVAFSRVYLSQHFVIDIIAGVVVGIFAVVFVLELLEKGSLRKRTSD